MRYNGNKFSVYESEEKTVLGLLDELGSQVNHNTDNFKNKTDLHGDHKGSWQGLSKPTLSEEGMRATVEKINEVDIPKLNEQLETIERKIDYNVLDYGIIGDGLTDYTNEINMAIQEISLSGGGILKFPKGEYLINTIDSNINKEVHSYGNFEGGIHLKDNVSLIGENAILITKQNNNKHQSIIYAREVKNCTIDGFNIYGDLKTHLDLDTEWGHGIFITHSNNITVKNCKIYDTVGDGIYVGIQYFNTSKIETENISIENCLIKGVSRNGISLCSGIGVNIKDCTIIEVARRNPQAGIDIEPEGHGDINPIVKDVFINNVSFYNCGNVGIITYLREPQQKYENINITNCYVEGSKRGYHTIAVDGYGNNGKRGGNINFINCHSNLAKENGFLIEENTINCPTIILKDCKVSNCNTDNLSSNKGSAFYINKLNGFNISPGNVNIINPYVEDNRETTAIYSPFAFFSEVKRIKTPINLTIENPLRADGKNKISLNGMEGVNILNDGKNLFMINSEDGRRNTIGEGYTIFNSAWSANGIDVFVPSPDWVQEGMEVTLLNGGEGKTLTIDCASEVGSVVPIYPFTKRYIRSNKCGSSLKIKKINGILVVISQVGDWIESDS